MFRKLCGPTPSKNVVMVTNKWEALTDPQLAESRTAELAGRDKYFKPLLDNGARMFSHKNTAESAQALLNLIVGGEHLPLRIQEQLVNEGKGITETDAAEELNRKHNEHIKKHEKGRKRVTDGIEQATKDGDEDTRRQLEAENARLNGVINELRNGSQRLESDYQKQKQRIYGRTRKVESEANRIFQHMKDQHLEVMGELEKSLRTNTAAPGSSVSNNDGWITIPIYE